MKSKTPISILFTILITFLFGISCRGTEPEKTNIPKLVNANNDIVSRNHILDSAETSKGQIKPHKYIYRTGTSGNYSYNYNVVGTDDNSNILKGNITTKGKYGSGQLTLPSNKTIEISVEWIDRGVLIATDKDLKTYKLYIE